MLLINGQSSWIELKQLRPINVGPLPDTMVRGSSVDFPFSEMHTSPVPYIGIFSLV